MRNKKRTIIGWVIFFLCWYLLSVSINNDILLANPIDVFHDIIGFLQDAKFYRSIGYTVIRVFTGYVCSLSVALVIYLIALWNKKILDFFHPVLTLTKSIPNISYMIMAIIWLGSEGSVTLIVFMILFPVFLQAFEAEDNNMSQGLHDVILIYEESFLHRVLHYVLPGLIPIILHTSAIAISFGFKVGVMAEILTSVRVGIGRQMHVAQINLLTSQVFGWTIIIMLISSCTGFIFSSLSKHYYKKINHS